MQIDTATGAAVDDGHRELGRDGKLTNDHAYLTAVVLLRRRELALDARDEILAELRKGYDGEATTARSARIVPSPRSRSWSVTTCPTGTTSASR